MGMSGDREGVGVIRECVKQEWSACDAGADQVRMGRQGKKRMKLVTKEKLYSWFM